MGGPAVNLGGPGPPTPTHSATSAVNVIFYFFSKFNSFVECTVHLVFRETETKKLVGLQLFVSATK